MLIINILDVGRERYEINTSSDILGRRWDNLSEEVKILFPTYELDNNTECIMIVTRNGKTIDNITVSNNVPFKVTSNLSQYESMEIGFSFSKTDYIKNSEIKKFRFLPAQKPNDFIPVPPEEEHSFFELRRKAFTGVDSDDQTSEYVFKNMAGDEVARVEKSTGGGGGIPDAPSDNIIYGRKNKQWVEVSISVVDGGEFGTPFTN